MTEPIAENGPQIDGEARTDLPEGEAPEAPKGSKEAKYRVERNEARAERDALAARVEQFQRLDIERVASESLSAPVDFWLSGNGVDAYLDDDGNVDVERVRDDAKILLAERPGLRRLDPAVDRSQGSGYVTPGKSAPTFSDLLSS